MNFKLHTTSKILYAFLMALFSVWGWGQTPFIMANGNYSENFSDIANWGANFVSGAGANYWSSVPINATGTIPDGKKTTKSSASWSTSTTTGGIQKGSEALIFLSTGNTSNGEAVAVDLLLDFSGRVAGTMSFDWLAVDNSSGTRPTSMRVYWSIDGNTFTELTNAQILDKVSPNSGSITSITLPAQFNNSSTARIRFYNHAGNSQGSGTRDKIQIDNLSITSTAGSTPTIYTAISAALDSFSEIYGSGTSDVRSFKTSAENLTANLVVTPPANWEISLSPNSGFTTSAISLTPSSNNVAQTTIYVRLANGSSIGSYSGNITLSSTGAATKNIAVSGNINIGTPVATPAANINNTSFNANWNAVQGANGYFIDVYKLLSTALSEGFDGSLTPPTGWTFTGLGTYTTSGLYGTDSPSLKFDSSDDRILTSLYTSDVKELKFWLIGNGTNTTSPSSLLVEGFNGSAWVTIDTITPISTTATTYVYNSTSSVVLPANIRQFRFTYTKNTGNIGFDDYSIILNQKNFVAGFENKSLANVQTVFVDPLTPGTDYYYNVRSTNGSVTSTNSNTIAVTTTANTTWNGTVWSSGTPSATIEAIIAGTYSTTSQPAFTSKSITIKNGGVLEINGTNTINAADITVEDGGNLVIKDSGVLNQTGSFKVLKNSASVQNKYAFWSSPVANQNLFTAYANGSSSTAPLYVMSYDPATNLYPTVANDNANFTNNAGKGYSIKVPATNASLVFGGVSQVPNNGTINVALSNAGDGYNLIGNPYPSNISLADFYTANNSAIEPTLWFWDNTTGNVTTQTGNTSVNVGFATFNAQSGTWTEAPNTQSYSSASLNSLGSFAKISQGFIVKSINGTAATFTNAMRTSAAAVTTNKNVNPAEGKYWIRLTTSYGNALTQAITYNQGASDAYDGYDSRAMGMGSDAFYSLAGTEKLVIQGKAPFQINDVVPLGNKHFENGDFTISLSHKEGLFTHGQPIYLHDKQNGTYTNLQSGNYTFSANAGDFTNRFEIVYKLNVLSTNEAEKKSFEVYRDGEDFVVRNHHNIQSVEVFDAAGRKIQHISANSKSVIIKLQTKGVYILKAVSGGKQFTQKIIK